MSEGVPLRENAVCSVPGNNATVCTSAAALRRHGLLSARSLQTYCHTKATGFFLFSTVPTMSGIRARRISFRGTPSVCRGVPQSCRGLIRVCRVPLMFIGVHTNVCRGIVNVFSSTAWAAETGGESPWIGSRMIAVGSFCRFAHDPLGLDTANYCFHPPSNPPRGVRGRTTP